MEFVVKIFMAVIFLEEDVISFDEDKPMFPRHRVRRNHRSLNQSLKSLNNSSEKFENKIKSLNNSSERFNDKNIGIKSELNGNGTNAASRKLQQLVDFDVPQVYGVTAACFIAVRRTQLITIGQNFFQQTMCYCYNGYIVNNNNTYKINFVRIKSCS